MKDHITSGAYSDLKILYHTDKIRDILDGKRTSPIYVRIKPTNLCNQNCYYCGSKDGNVPEDRRYDSKAVLPWEIMEGLLNDLNELGVKAVTLSGGGEPLIYPYIKECLLYLQEHNIEYSVITNGQAMQGEIAELFLKAKWIRFSLETINRQNYKRIRGVDTLECVLNNIRGFCDKKGSDCTVGVNCVVTKDNYDEIYEFCKCMKELGVDNVKFSPLRLNGDIAEYHEPIRECVNGQLEKAKAEFVSPDFFIIDKYEDDMSLQKEFKKQYERCVIQEIFGVIGADGGLYRCHQTAYTKEGYVGSLYNNTFKDLWFSTKVVQDIRKFNACENCDFRCVFDERNMLLNQLLSLDLNHVNFI